MTKQSKMARQQPVHVVNMFDDSYDESRESDKSVDSMTAVDSGDDSSSTDQDPLLQREDDETENLHDEGRNVTVRNVKLTCTRKGRKAQWQNRHINDLVNIVCNNEYYKKRLIFMNTKNAKNGEIYGKIETELRRLYTDDGDDSFPFTVSQIRNKFKRCVADCKKIAMTVKTATGIKRIQEERQYGTWFKELFPLVKTRDSCQPDKAVEPSAVLTRKRKAGSGTDMSDCSPPSKTVASDSREEVQSDKSLFVPLKKTSRKAKREDSSISAALDIMKRVVEHDPTKDLLAFFKEENDRAREHELRMAQMFMSSGHHQPHLQGHYSTPFTSSPAYSQPAQHQRQFHYYNDTGASGGIDGHRFPVHPQHRSTPSCTQSRAPSQVAGNVENEQDTQLPMDGTPTYHQL